MQVHTDHTGRDISSRHNASLRLGRIVSSGSSVSLKAYDAFDAAVSANDTSVPTYNVRLLDIDGGEWSESPLNMRDRSDQTIQAACLTSGLAVGRLVELREMNGRWWIDVAPSGGASCLECRFFIVSSDSDTMTALCMILATSYGCQPCDLPETFLGCTVIEVHDPSGCFFNEPAEQLFDREGWAKYMLPVSSSVYPYAATPQWEVHALCCQLNSCVT